MYLGYIGKCSVDMSSIWEICDPLPDEPGVVLINCKWLRASVSGEQSVRESRLFNICNYVSLNPKAVRDPYIEHIYAFEEADLQNAIFMLSCYLDRGWIADFWIMND